MSKHSILLKFLFFLFAIKLSSSTGTGGSDADGGDNNGSNYNLNYSETLREQERKVMLFRAGTAPVWLSYCTLCADIIGDFQGTDGSEYVDAAERRTFELVKEKLVTLSILKYEGRDIPIQHYRSECTAMLRSSLIDFIRLLSIFSATQPPQSSLQASSNPPEQYISDNRAPTFQSPHWFDPSAGSLYIRDMRGSKMAYNCDQVFDLREAADNESV